MLKRCSAEEEIFRTHLEQAYDPCIRRESCKKYAYSGTAADIIKIAMIKVDERMKAENLRARLVLQVHDELIVEAPQDESMRVALIVQEEMENAVKMSVPLTADAAIGRTWYDAKG